MFNKKKKPGKTKKLPDQANVEDVLQYSSYFSNGKRVQVELPLEDENPLRDDAKVVSANRDLLELQLSGRVISREITLEIGTELFLRTGKKGQGYKCRALFLRNDSLHRVHVRLVGKIIPFNERAFLRVDVFIPLTYRPFSLNFMGGTTQEEEESSQRKGSRAKSAANPKNPLPVAANLSIAGVRINIPRRFNIDELLELKLYLSFGDSSSQNVKTLPLVGQVMHVVELSQPGYSTLYGTMLRFVVMDDPSRAILVRFISNAQSEQLGRLREQSLRQAIQIEDTESDESFFSERKIREMLQLIFVIVLCAGFIFFLANYRHPGNKGEIENTFEKQIKSLTERK